MEKTELLVLNSICETKDIGPALAGSHTDHMFVDYPDVWDYIKEYYGKYKTVPDAEMLEKKFDLFDKTEVKGPTQYYMDKFKEEFVNGQLHDIALKLKSKTGKIPSTKVLSGVLADLMDLQATAVESQDLDITDFEAAKEDLDQVRQKALEMGGVPGIPTGIDFIDSAYTSGLAGGDLIVVLGWTGRAKSLLTTKICVNAFKAGKRPMIISLEMRARKVRNRAYTMMGEGKFKNSDLEVGIVNEDDFRTWSKDVKGRGFHVISHDGNEEVTPNFVQSKIDQYKPDLIVLDYAQLMSDNANSSDMTARMRNMSKEFKRLATANDIPIILISSATPDNTASLNTPPIIEQVAWSKQLSFDADMAMAVHRHDGFIEDGWVIIEIAGRKNRNGDLFSGYFKANINEGIYEEFFSLEEIGEM